MFRCRKTRKMRHNYVDCHYNWHRNSVGNAGTSVRLNIKALVGTSPKQRLVWWNVFQCLPATPKMIGLGDIVIYQQTGQPQGYAWLILAAFSQSLVDAGWHKAVTPGCPNRVSARQLPWLVFSP